MICRTNIHANWRANASVNNVIIDSNDVLSPVEGQATVWTNADVVLGAPSETNSEEIYLNQIPEYLSTKLIASFLRKKEGRHFGPVLKRCIYDDSMKATGLSETTQNDQASVHKAGNYLGRQ